MPKEIVNTLILAVSFLALFAAAELIYFAFKPKAEYTRKFVHFGTGFLTLLFPVMLDTAWAVLFLCASFAVILLISLKYNFLRSINNIDRKSHGSISYPASVFASFLFYLWFSGDYNLFEGKYLYFYLPVLTLAICDPVAALTGRRWPVKKFKVGDGHKSLMGCFSFFVTSLALSIVLFYQLSFSSQFFPAILLASVLIAVLATFSEAFSPKGLDNLSIPFAVMLGLFISRYLLFSFQFD
jgi:phytol kinase